MELSEATRKDLSRLAEQVVDDAAGTLELECKFKNVSIDQFTRVCQYYQRHAELSQPIDTVDVMFVGGKRYTIPDVRQASDALLHKRLPDVDGAGASWSCIVKQALDRIDIPSFDVAITARREVPVPNAAFAADLSSRSGVQLVRLKRRFSAMLPSSPFLRVDLTAVQETRQAALIVSGKVETRYEMEIEVVRQPDVTAEMIERHLLAAISVMLQVVQNTNGAVTSVERANAVRQQYQRLASYAVDKRPLGLIGPQPITIQRVNVQPATGAADQITVMRDYTVTDKADGERGILFIDADGACFILDNRLRVTATLAHSASHKNCILDVEVLASSSTYLCFDVFIMDAEVVATLPLLTGDPTRQDRASLVQIIVKDINHASFQAKDHVLLSGDNPLAACHAVLTKKKAYRTDGLIFTPAMLGAGCDVPDQKKARLSGPWHRQFKWKPQSENTIDFQVKWDGARTLVKDKDGVMRPALTSRLFVGFDPYMDALITPRRYVELRTAAGGPRAPADASSRYRSVPFTPEGGTMPLVLENDDAAPRCENGDILMNGAVVECRWEDGWHPIRLRTDKSVGNNIRIAMENWRSIQEPVLEEHITGKKPSPAPSEDRDDRVYYARNTASSAVDRADLGTSRMARFHSWLKVRLITQNKGQGVSLMDVGCGRAGDLRKWGDAGFQVVLGIDVSADGLENPYGGAYSRLIGFSGPTKCMFLEMDAREPLALAAQKGLPNAEYADLARLAWGMPSPASVTRKFFQRDFSGCAVKGFDLVTCQFAIHYFMESAETLATFAENVKSLLKPGGRFVATCLDGDRVHALLEDSASVSRGALWAIERTYKKKTAFGSQIVVYVDSINQRIPEYLVQKDVLIDALKKHGLVLERAQAFEEAYDDWPDNNRMTEAEREFSYLNMSLVFTRA